MVIFSTVRCNPQGKLGFVSDAPRMNVAITRAKRYCMMLCYLSVTTCGCVCRGLVVVGNRPTLSSSGLWKAWLDWIDIQNGS